MTYEENGERYELTNKYKLDETMVVIPKPTTSPPLSPNLEKEFHMKTFIIINKENMTTKLRRGREFMATTTNFIYSSIVHLQIMWHKYDELKKDKVLKEEKMIA